MKNFYKLNESGYPETYNGKEALDGFQEFTAVTNEDGTVTYQPEELDTAMKAIDETDRISSIKAKAGELINEQYPSYKQLNIIRLGGQDLEDMTAFIDNIRAKSDEAETNGTELEDIVWNN